MGIEKEQRIPKARKEGLVVQQLDEEVLVYDRQRQTAHCLNPTAAWVWKRCDGKATIGAVAQALREQTGKPVEEELVWLAVEQLAKRHLLEAKVGKGHPTNGMTRREMVKRAGLAAAIALPAVTSLIAPKAAQAATCLAAGQPCTTSAQCCSGLCNAGTCA